MTANNLFMGKKYFAEGDYDVAKIFLTKAAEENNIEAYGYLGDIYLETGKIEESKFWYVKSALKGDFESQISLGNLYPNDFNTALFWYKKALNSKNREVFFRLGELYKKFHKYDIALQFYEKAKDPVGWKEMSRIYKNVYKDKDKERFYLSKYLKEVQE